MPTEQTDTTQTPPEEITYTPTVWADGADGGTPINAANLNNMEEAIVALVERTTKQIVTSMIADGAVTNAKLDQTLRDSLSREDTKTLSEGVRFKKSNGWVLVRVYTSRSIQQGWNELGTLPVGYRPDGDLYFPAQVGYLEARGYVSPSGRVALYHFSATSSTSGAQFTISFPI